MTVWQRHWRALRWPAACWAFYRAGLPLRDAWRATHLWVWGYLDR